MLYLHIFPRYFKTKRRYKYKQILQSLTRHLNKLTFAFFFSFHFILIIMTVDYEIYKEGGILKDRYQKIEDISEGSYGYVSLAKDLKEKKLVAVKYIFKLDEDDEDENDDYQDHDDDRDYDSSQEKIQVHQDKKRSLISSNVKSRLTNDICLEAMYEFDIQTKIGKHKNIVQLLDFFDSYIIMEYCSGGDLYEAIKDDIVPRTTKSITHIITQIIDSIEFVHNKNIYHRDIKPENILITGIDWTIKLTDWGLATTDETSMDRSVGSERYMAPELFDSNLDLEERKEPYQCAKVDLWAMGIVFLNIVFHKNPFSVANQSDKSFCYFAANREALFDVFSAMTYDFFQVLRYCLTIDPMNRDLKQMRNELDNLNEYTFDDEYYNNEENEDYSTGYDTEVSETMTVTPGPESLPKIQPPSSAPVSLPTPINSSKPLPQLVNKQIPTMESDHTKDKTLVESMHNNNNNNNNNNNTSTINSNQQITNLHKTLSNDETNSQSSQDHNKKQLDIPKFNIIQDKLYNHYKHPNANKSQYAHNNTNNNNNQHHYETINTSRPHNNNNDHIYPDRAKSTPKFKYHKKSRGKKRNGRYHIKPIKIENRNKSKIIKHSRKPLGIPTPNTHINSYFHDYKKSKEKHNFNTRDFFTPPSVQNRYMEGVFDHKYRNNNNKSKHYNNFGNNNQHGSYGGKSWNNNNNNNLNLNYGNNGQNNSYKYNKFRRPSTTGNSSYNVNSIKNAYGGQGQRNSFNNGSLQSGFLRRGSLTTYSPGSYIPPNARNSVANNNVNNSSMMNNTNNNPLPNMAYASWSTYSNIPDISTVLDNSPDSTRSIHSHTSSGSGGSNGRRHSAYTTNAGRHNSSITSNHELNVLNDDGHESDGALFTLEENDSANLVKNFNNLTLNNPSTNTHDHPDLFQPSSISTSSPLHHESTSPIPVGTPVHNNPINSNNEGLPDLLKSPASTSVPMNPLINPNYNSPKPGIYVPPHHRRMSTSPQDNMLSVSHNHINYGHNNARRTSHTQDATNNNNTQGFNIPINHSQSTISLQNEYVFADNNDALHFEDDEEIDPHQNRTIFGPYEIYDNESDHNKLNKFQKGRKSSTLQDEIVGSLEQYKNNWLMQQQSQQE